MKLIKIIIEDYKSIQKIELDIKKYGPSYTTVFLGVNESGKSNILDAISYLNTPTEEFDYHSLHNQKDEEGNPIDLWFYLDFDKEESWLDFVRAEIGDDNNILDFNIKNICKNVYLQKDTKFFSESYEYDINNVKKGLVAKKIQKTITVGTESKTVDSFDIKKKPDADETYSPVDEAFVIENFNEAIVNSIKEFEPQVSFWKPSDKYLLGSVDLTEFREKPSSNIPLRNIFALSGFIGSKQIKEKIDETSNDNLRRKLMGRLSDNATNYVKNVWDHDINFDIEISDTKKIVVSIKDDGKNNEHNYHKMTSRSEGFKQFISLILSLSIEAKKMGKKNNLILIDEPETHLHPSGIRDLRDELLEIGKTNYLFVSTHSPFLVDRKNKERNIIIKKNKSAITEKILVGPTDDITGDEVLDIAFGLSVYRDLFSPYRILVEGASDKIILQKIFTLKSFDFGITNGTGSNIVQVATKLNSDEIDVMVLTDDDKEGIGYRDKILSIGGVFNTNNVVTIRDLIGQISAGATIEDFLRKPFIESKFKTLYKKEFGADVLNFSLIETSPLIDQIKIYLQQNNKFSIEFLEKLKMNISNDFKPTRTTLSNDYQLLDQLVDEINKRLHI
ncbi:MAG: AAA family ATPase [bacterium]